MKVSIIVPNYNGAELLKKNLPKVLKAAEWYHEKLDGEMEIIIVDDGSSDGSVEEIKSLKLKAMPAGKQVKNDSLKLKIIENEKNLGFSSAVNIGVRSAEGDIVVLLNTDVAPEENFLEVLITHFNDPQIFAVGCLDKSIEGESVVLRGRGEGAWIRGLLVHWRGEVNRPDTLWVSGGSGAFRHNLWEKFGGFDPLYNPFYWEDIDLSYRAQKAGYKILFEPKSAVVHKHLEGAIKSKYSPFKIKAIAYRNQFVFVWKNITDWDKKISHLFWLPYHLLKAILRGDAAFFLGFFGSLLKLPIIIKFRFKAKKLFIQNDRQILK